MRLLPTIAALFLLGAHAAVAADTGIDAASSPGGLGTLPPETRPGVVVLQLTPEASTQVRVSIAPESRSADQSTVALGIPSIDRLARALGVERFVPEFPGSQPPTPGSREPDLTAFWLAHLPDGVDVEPSRAAFAALAEIRSASASSILPVEAVPNDSLWSLSLHFYQSNRRDIHAPEAWDVTTGDRSVIIALIDTGVLLDHPDLGPGPGDPGQFWTNSVEVTGVSGVDDDGNGYIDDVRGWDFVALPNNGGVTVGEDWVDADPDPNDFAGHGSAVAGVIGAHSDNTIGVTGTVWQASIMPLRIGWSTNAAPLGQVDMTFVAQAIHYAVQMGASIINCSFASIYQPDLAAALDAAYFASVSVVSSAGSASSTFTYLAARSEVLCATSSDSRDRIPSFTNRQTFVDVAAPGTSLPTATVTRPGVDSLGMRQPSYTTGASGSSFSAALATGVAGLLHAQRLAAGEPRPHPVETVLRLHDTADDISALNPGITGYGGGRLNAFRALTDPVGSFVTLREYLVSGPAVPLPGDGAPCCAAVPLEIGRIAVVDVGQGRLVTTYALPSSIIGGIAAAYMSENIGFVMFCATQQGQIWALDEFGQIVSGWPVDATPGVPGSTPCLGDLDGDGVLEVLWGGDDGYVHAWSAAGKPFPGFPVAVSSPGDNLVLSLSDLDGIEGVEIVAVQGTGIVHAIHGNGITMAGWPVFIGAVAYGAAITELAEQPGPAIIVAGGTQTQILNVDGTIRHARFDLPQTFGEVVAGDLNGDGHDEIVVPRWGPPQLSVYDDRLVHADFGTWPKLYSGVPYSTPIIGPLGGNPAPEILWQMQGPGFVAVDSSATIIGGFPKPGAAGMHATLWDFDGDGRTEILGTPPDLPGVFVYQEAPGSWGKGAHWPTPRANFARTGSRLYSPGIDRPTAALLALVSASAEPGRVSLDWFAAQTTDLRAILERRSDSESWRELATLVPDGTGHLRYQDVQVEPGARYTYRLAVSTSSGVTHWGETSVQVPTTFRFHLAGARPHPARGSVQIAFGLDRRDPALLELFDLAGRRILSRALEGMAPGEHVVQLEGDRRLEAGLYLVRLSRGSDSRNARVVFIP